MLPKHCTLEQAWRLGANLLHLSESAQLDSQLLLLHVLNKPDRAYLLTWPEKILTVDEINNFQLLLEQRIQGIPIAHILGYKEFWGLTLAVNSSTLIPRPDTEIIVESVLDLYQTQLDKPLTVLDLGTGTGALALAIKSECETWQIDAVEFNQQAYLLAKQNAQTLKLPINLYHGSWFTPLNESANQSLESVKRYDLIVTNPPYIDEHDPHLVQGDVRFEPRSALTSPEQGLADIEYIIRTSRAYLHSNAWLIIEHGYQQAPFVAAFFKQYGFSHVHSRTDLANHPRITLGQFI